MIPQPLEQLGVPAIAFTGRDFLALRLPVVYVWLRRSEVLYVGCGAHGISRPFFAEHHRLNAMKRRDRLLVWTCESRQDALALEARLVAELKPHFNTSRTVVKNRRPYGTAKGLYRDRNRWYLEFVFRGVRYRKSLGDVPLKEATMRALDYRSAVYKKMTDKKIVVGKGCVVKKKPRAITYLTHAAGGHDVSRPQV